MMLVTAIYSGVSFTQTETMDEIKNQIIKNKQSASSMSFGTDGSLGSISMIDVIVEDPTGTIGG